MKEIIIDNTNYGKRVDKFIMALLPSATKSFIYKMFRKKNIVLNDKKINGFEILKQGDQIKVYFSDETFMKFEKVKKQNKHIFSLPDIVFEDENILVINKAKGIFSQPFPLRLEKTRRKSNPSIEKSAVDANNLILPRNSKKYNSKKISIIDQIYSHYENTDYLVPHGVKIGTSNRLDVDTTGIIISAKTARAARDINNLIKEHKVKKTYLAITKGCIENAIFVENSIEKAKGIAKISESGLPASMKIIPLKTSRDFSFIEIDLNTGRYHQIRISLADMNCPIVGDRKYGDSEVNANFKRKFNINSQVLHSYSYEFLEEVAGKRYNAFYANKPKEFEILANVFS